jgi:hypothetical protein
MVTVNIECRLNKECLRKLPDAALQEGEDTTSRQKSHAQKNAPFHP